MAKPSKADGFWIPNYGSAGVHVTPIESVTGPVVRATPSPFLAEYQPQEADSSVTLEHKAVIYNIRDVTSAFTAIMEDVVLLPINAETVPSLGGTTVVDLNDPSFKKSVSVYGANYGNTEYGPDNVVLVADLPSLPKLKSVLQLDVPPTPGMDSSVASGPLRGELNMRRAIESSQTGTYLTEEGVRLLADNLLSRSLKYIDSNPEYTQEEKAMLRQYANEKYSSTTGNILNSMPGFRTKMISPLTGSTEVGDQVGGGKEGVAAPTAEVAAGVEAAGVLPDYTKLPKEGNLKEYVHGNIKTRNPNARANNGDFFTVEMLGVRQKDNSGGVELFRVDIPTADNTLFVQSLRLYTSPSTVSINNTKKIQRTQTLTKWVEEHWGDEMDQVSFSGETFAFLDYSVNNLNKGAGEFRPGLTGSARSTTAPFQELRHLMWIFKNNGCIYQKANIDDDAADNRKMLLGVYDAEYAWSLGEARVTPREFFNFENPGTPYKVLRHPRAGMVKSRLYIRLTNSYFTSIGYFDSFDVIEAAEKPFNLSYSVSFKAEHTTWVSPRAPIQTSP